MKSIYNDIFNRNIGLITPENQQRLKNSKVAVFGVGGLGGVIAEVLVRSGIGSIILADCDKFETSNLNRQVFAYSDTIGDYKVDVAELFLKKINPELKVKKYLRISSSNISEMMGSTDVALLALDDVVPVIVISRYAQQHNVPLVEGWALPFGNVRVFTGNTPSLEQVYHLDDLADDPERISPDERKALNLKMLFELKKISGIEGYYPEEAMQRISRGQVPSFAPMVWFTSVLMGFEAIKIILSLGQIAYAPGFALYDPFNHKQLHK
ncbi:MAG: ThiF family adenylyltransferase [Bacteroidales bacterium]|nr:ThiF family adenylyltransferase [Bacteroidales bacterium]